MIGIPTQCLNCRHLSRDGEKVSMHCKAFSAPNFIPFEIWDLGVEHTKPFPSDHGIRFEPLEEPAIEQPAIAEHASS